MLPIQYMYLCKLTYINTSVVVAIANKKIVVHVLPKDEQFLYLYFVQ